MWAVRLFPSRSRATEACADGRVEVNGRRAKPATKVDVGDRVDIRDKRGTKLVVVIDPIEQRVGAPLAVTCYEDLTPADRVQPNRPPVVGKRDRGAGRPTKRDRRRLDAFRSSGGGGSDAS